MRSIRVPGGLLLVSLAIVGCEDTPPPNPSLESAEGKIELGGRKGVRYVYRHYDGPVFMRTVSFVVPHQGKWLGLEFRTQHAELDPVQSRILSSFRFH